MIYHALASLVEWLFLNDPEITDASLGRVHGQRVEGPEVEGGDHEAEEEEGPGDLHRAHAGLRRKAQRRKSQGNKLKLSLATY